MRRRMAQMNARMNAGMNNGGAAPAPAPPAAVVQPPPPAPVNNMMNNQGKPGATPNQGVLEAVKKVNFPRIRINTWQGSVP